MSCWFVTLLLYYITTCDNRITFSVKESHARAYKQKSLGFTFLTYFNNVASCIDTFCITVSRYWMTASLYFNTTDYFCRLYFNTTFNLINFVLYYNTCECVRLYYMTTLRTLACCII